VVLQREGDPVAVEYDVEAEVAAVKKATDEYEAVYNTLKAQRDENVADVDEAFAKALLPAQAARDAALLAAHRPYYEAQIDDAPTPEAALILTEQLFEKYASDSAEGVDGRGH
jgi:hypothetical protein